MATLTEVQPAATLTNDEILRYSRHLIMPEVGMDGQRKLKAARVLCIGAGGLGSPVAMYLTAAGVGTIGIVDFDVVDFSNLQRQIIHGTSDVGRSKLASAKDRLEALIGRLLIFDALRMKFREVKLRKDSDCPVCSAHPTVTALIDYDQFCGVAPHAEAQVESSQTDITATELKERLDRKDDVFILD